MRFLTSRIKMLGAYVYRHLKNKTEGFEKQIFLFGWIFFFNYPIYYFIWRYADVQGYENSIIRGIAVLLCIPLIFVHRWPKKIKGYLPIYWYASVTYCLPFFFTFMTLMNEGSVVWLLNLVLALLLIFILLDLIGLLFSVLIGAILSCIFFHFLSPSSFRFTPGTIDLTGAIATFVAALFVGGVFARNREVIIARNIKKKSEVADKAKTEFIANMSHDMRTPITGITGTFVELKHLTDKIGTNSDAGKKLSDMFLYHIVMGEKSTHELLNLFNGVLETISLESGEISDSKEVFNIRSVVNGNIYLLMPAAIEKGLDLLKDIDSNVPENLYGSNKSLNRILMNLISNAIKFTEEGHVKIKVGLETCKSSNKEEITLIISIEDTGIGIPEDKFDQIFENLSKLSSSYKGLYKGYGLGLYGNPPRK